MLVDHPTICNIDISNNDGNNINRLIYIINK